MKMNAAGHCAVLRSLLLAPAKSPVATATSPSQRRIRFAATRGIQKPTNGSQIGDHISVQKPIRIASSFRSITNRRSAAGRAPDALSNHEDRDARTVGCNGWLCDTRVAL